MCLRPPPSHPRSLRSPSFTLGIWVRARASTTTTIPTITTNSDRECERESHKPASRPTNSSTILTFDQSRTRPASGRRVHQPPLSSHHPALSVSVSLSLSSSLHSSLLFLSPTYIHTLPSLNSVPSFTFQFIAGLVSITGCHLASCLSVSLDTVIRVCDLIDEHGITNLSIATTSMISLMPARR